MGRLPMFPLGNVVLPGEVLPLHVFEPRYHQLVIDCLGSESGDAEFGIALIERGHEVGGGDQRASLATLTRIVRVAPMPTRRFALVVNAVSRLSVLEWAPDDPYPIADVEPWADHAPDDPAAFMERVAMLSGHVDTVCTMNQQASERGATNRPAIPIKLSDEPIRASYQLAAKAPLGPADRYHVLAAPTVEARLDILGAALDDVEAALRFRLA